MKNRDYTIDELVQDQSFRRMVKGTAGLDEIDKWSSWIEENDQNRHKAKIASSEIIGFEFGDHPTMPNIEKEWSKLYRSTLGRQDVPVISRSHKDSTLRWIYRAAAAILLVCAVGIQLYIYFQNKPASPQLTQIIQEKTVTTRDNEQKILSFSNGSKIILNSNSRLTYATGMLHNGTIQVTLHGEAYFHGDGNVLDEQPEFAVTTPDGVVKDIGTTFVVTVIKDRTRVVLQEGLVKIEGVSGKSPKREVLVREGEMVEFNKAQILKKKMVNSTFYTSWATGVMQFEQTKISRFAQYVEKRFGVKVQIVDPDLADIKIDGAVYFKSLEGLVRSVSSVIKVPVYQSEDKKTVYIGNPNNSSSDQNR